MNALLKLLIGVILLVIPLGMYAFELMNGVNSGVNIPVIGNLHLWKSLIVLLTGSIPPFVMLIGLFIIWLELDELKIEKELKEEEKKEETEKIKNKVTTANSKTKKKPTKKTEKK